jgi:hypothetical protein
MVRGPERAPGMVRVTLEAMQEDPESALTKSVLASRLSVFKDPRGGLTEEGFWALAAMKRECARAMVI